jgi:hypothetical protein
MALVLSCYSPLCTLQVALSLGFFLVEEWQIVCSTIIANVFGVFFGSVLARSLGEAGELEPETAALLADNDVDDSEFDEKVRI